MRKVLDKVFFFYYEHRQKKKRMLIFSRLKEIIVKRESEEITPASKGKCLISLNIIFFGLFIVFLFGLTGCSGRGAKYNYINYEKLKLPDKSLKLRSNVINKFEINWGSELEIIGDYLLLADSKADEIIKIIDLKTNDLIKSFGRLGQGPDEFIGLSQIIPDTEEKVAFWAYDITTRNLKKFNLEAIFNDNFYPEKVIVMSASKSGLPLRLTMNGNGKILATGYFFKDRIGIYDLDGNYIRGIGKVPVKLRDERFAPQHSHGFDGHLTFNDGTQEIFVATRLGSIVERYSLHGNLISTYTGPDLFFPEYEIVPAGDYYTMTYNKKTRFGYLDIDYSRALNKIFLLYSGEYQFNQKKIAANYSDTIYIFDVDKESIIEQIKLDRKILNMTLSHDGSAIFGLSESGDILKFKYDTN
jgi:hypothetical protein